MFTGIVEEMGTVVDVVGDRQGRRLVVRAPIIASDLEIGASIAVNGACLTAVSVKGDTFAVDTVIETLDRTNLGALGPGDPVNLERAMRADGRFDGHVVQGHVDGVGLVVETAPEGSGLRLALEVPEGLLRWVVEKGSVTVDGVSLTVAALEGRRVEIALIPHTIEATTLGRLVPGDEVNLEGDILGKYVERILEMST